MLLAVLALTVAGVANEAGVPLETPAKEIVAERHVANSKGLIGANPDKLIVTDEQWRIRCREFGRARAEAMLQASGRPRITVPTFDEAYHCTPGELYGPVEDALWMQERAKPPKVLRVDERVREALVGPDGIHFAPIDLTPLDTSAARYAAAVAEETTKRSVGHWNRFKAGMTESFVGQFSAHVGDAQPTYDPEFMRFYQDNWQDIESFAKSDGEVSLLREAVSAKHLNSIKGRIIENRQRKRIIDSSDMGWAVIAGSNALTLLPLVLLMFLSTRKRPLAALTK